MSDAGRPFALIVDDEPDERFSFAENLKASLEVEVVHPDDVNSKHLALADLVLVDYRLDHWPARDSTDHIALRPLNGVALIGILRAHAELDRVHSSPAFSLLSAHLGDLSPDFPPEYRPHILAESLNFEWVFHKGNIEETVPQIAILAKTMKNLPRSWKHEDFRGNFSQLEELLGLKGDMPGSKLAYEDIEESHPPVHELSESSHGLSIVRWLLHRILPYPTFIYDYHYLAARLRVEPASLKHLLTSDANLRKALEKIEYSGVLADFLGSRWWRSGVEAWIWEVTNGQPHRPESIHQALEGLGVQSLQYVAGDREIVCIAGTDYQPFPELFRFDEAVRIQPDHWPPYADQAWTSIEAAQSNPGLRALVIHDDAERLS